MMLSTQRMAADTCRKLQTVQTRLEAMAADWSEVDDCFHADLERAADAVKTILSDMREVYPPRKAGAR
ncbi:hypothetical protein RDV84_00300 [Lysobacter yananisis]|uniref:Uncharacterized protein n=1 Tax=Lysobacter yananisis TaxID=1003114 RepID=A0ABY9P8V8_9GAMM|nr:hypothetical protein [Lysobacter yananisis]WMT03331.1 hypothetical protein RDV84_00300 [Lysobacter yananisis]